MKLFKRKPKLTPRENAERLYKEGMRSVQTETREDEMTQKVEPEEPIEESIVDVPPLEYKRESKLKEIKIWDATEELREYCAKRGIDYIHHSWPVDYGD